MIKHMRAHSRLVRAQDAPGTFRNKNTLFELAARWSLPELYRQQKWTFQRKYKHFEKKFSKIDKKFVSQSILEVDISSIFIKKLLNSSIFIKIRQIYYRLSYYKIKVVEKTLLFVGYEMGQLLESIARRFFYRFGETFFQSCCICSGKSISGIYNVLEASTQPPAQIDFFLL